MGESGQLLELSQDSLWLGLFVGENQDDRRHEKANDAKERQPDD